MNIYIHFWRDKIKQIKGLINPVTPFSTVIAIPEIETLGSRESSGYNGSLKTWTGEVQEGYKDIAVFRDLKTAIEETKTRFKDWFPGELTLRIQKNSLLNVDYTPIAFDYLIERYDRIKNSERNNREIYKWELVQKFQVLWKQYQDQEITFKEFFNQIQFANLIYPPIRSNYSHMLDVVPEEFEGLILLLFNEDVPLRRELNNINPGLAKYISPYRIMERVPGRMKGH